MSAISSLLIQIFQLLLALSVLVFVHEMGHFLMARLFKVRVDKFYLFFDWRGKALFRYKSKKSGTEFGIGWIPLGGYCKISGMMDERYLETGIRTEAQPYEMRSKSAWQRVLIMIGGILFNLIFAILIYAGLTFSQGSFELKSKEVTSGMMFSPVAQEVGFRDNDIIQKVDGKELNVLSEDFIKEVIQSKEVVVKRDGKELVLPIPKNMMQRVLASKEGMLGFQTPFVIDTIFQNSPGAIVDLRQGDRLLSIDTLSIMDYSEAQRFFALSAGKSCQIRILRGIDTLSLSITPDQEGHIGVGLAPFTKVYPVAHHQYGFFESIPLGIQRAWHTLAGYADNMKYVFTPEGANSVGGFISMGKLFSSSFSWEAFWMVVALLSIVFAFMNFLPIPLLDGAEILFLLIELVIRRKINERVIVKTKMVGLTLLLLIFLWANLNDVIGLF